MSGLPADIWITGASSGIGEEVARKLAKCGHNVQASARSAPDLERMERDTPGIRALPLDVTDREAVREAVDSLASRNGLPGLIVLSAGTYVPMGAQTFDADGFRDQVEVNLFGVVHMLEAVLPHYLRQKSGHIAIVASIAGYRGLPTSAAYGATKAALINLAESLRFDCHKAGVTIQLINPGFVKTPLTDRNTFKMPFLMSADDAADRLIAGLRSRRFEVTFPKRFTWLLKLMRILPYGLYFPLTSTFTGK